MVSDCQQKQHHGAQPHHLTCTEYHFELACDLVSLKVFLVTMIVTFLANNFQHIQ